MWRQYLGEKDSSQVSEWYYVSGGKYEEIRKKLEEKKVNIGTRWLPRTLSDFKNGISVSGLGLDNGVRKVTLSFGDQKMSGIFIEPEVSLVRTKFILTYINIDFYNSTTSPIMLYF